MSIPTPAEIIEEARRLKDFFEQHWILPWVEQRQTSQMWRHRFVHLLARLPDELFDSTMELLLEEPSFALKGLALHLVKVRGRESFAERAGAAFQDGSIHVRALAAAAIGQFAPNPGWEALLETKDGENAEVKKAVVDALKRIRDPRCIPLLARWVGRVGEDDELRSKACEALAEIGDEAGMPVLMRVLADESVVDDVRGEAARAVGLIGGPDARKILLEGLENPRPWIRARCAQGLGLLGDATVLDDVVGFLLPEHPWMVRTHAIEAVSRLGGRNAFSHLKPLLEDDEAQVRSEVCAALGNFESAEARKLLKGMLDDNALSVQLQALSALSRSTGQDFGFRLEEHQGTLNKKTLDAALAQARAYEV